MHSSISSSEPAAPLALRQRPAPYAKGAGVTLLLLALILAALETGTRVVFRRVSRLENRIMVDHRNALSLRPGTKPHILLLGNSLLLEGLDYDALHKSLAPDAEVTRFVIEGTTYYDWYYGIRRLLASGSRPDRIVLCMSALNLLGAGIRGDYSAYYLFQTQDIAGIARSIHYDTTKASNLVFARYSLFYAARNNMRNFILGKVDPAYSALINHIQFSRSQLPPSNEIEHSAEQRLRALNSECARYRVPFVFLIPPAIDAHGERELLEAGRLSGTSVSVPIAGGTLPADLFRDGFHLNSRGAAVFTDALARDLRATR